MGRQNEYACATISGWGTHEAGNAHTSPVEEVRAVLSREREALRELAHQLDDLCDVVVVLAVPRPRRRIEEIVSASDELEDLPGQDQIRSHGSLQRSGRRVGTQQ